MSANYDALIMWDTECKFQEKQNHRSVIWRALGKDYQTWQIPQIFKSVFLKDSEPLAMYGSEGTDYFSFWGDKINRTPINYMSSNEVQSSLKNILLCNNRKEHANIPIFL